MCSKPLQLSRFFSYFICSFRSARYTFCTFYTSSHPHVLFCFVLFCFSLFVLLLLFCFVVALWNFRCSHFCFPYVRTAVCDLWLLMSVFYWSSLRLFYSFWWLIYAQQYGIWRLHLGVDESKNTVTAVAAPGTQYCCCVAHGHATALKDRDLIPWLTAPLS